MTDCTSVNEIRTNLERIQNVQKEDEYRHFYFCNLSLKTDIEPTIYIE